MNILYISYDGLMEPLGQSQILQYLRLLARDHRIILLTYEKTEDLSNVSRCRTFSMELSTAGIEWIPLRYHKAPSLPATAYDMAVGLAVCIYLALRRRIEIVHARSYTPSLLALPIKLLFGSRFIFDMRSFWPDQRADSGMWPRTGLAYRLTKWFERRFLRHADVIISLTRAGVEVLRANPYLQDKPPSIEVIPTCTNLELFRPADGRVGGNRGSQPFTLGYVGNMGPWYLLDQMIECFRILRRMRPDAKFRIVNLKAHSLIRERFEAAGIPEGAYELKAVGYDQIPTEMGTLDAGILFLKAFPSSKGMAPTKVGEFLACGVPCLANTGIGDLDELLEGESVGIIVREFSENAMSASLERLLELAADPDTQHRCVNAACRHFSLEDGTARLDRIYRSLAGKGDDTR
ncbi:MAG: glycosyltransferase family 4 protein [Elusimicrobia bacterium]|nr:glycosyltransferase family 4 protein [Elusimicrobiota bacterium]